MRGDDNQTTKVTGTFADSSLDEWWSAHSLIHRPFFRPLTAMLLVAPLLMAIGYVPLARRAHLLAAPEPLVVSRVCRCAQVVAADDPNLPKRDAEVESATGGGWSSILPNARGLIIVAALGLTSYFAPDTALGRWLSEPPIQKVPFVEGTALT